ncbi:MAG: hypothetical protein Q4A75_04485 [Peptostreptococcaceae bacterium]|nr:hypothetical protein [Peptostreptococcaceae bacterium]
MSRKQSFAIRSNEDPPSRGFFVDDEESGSAIDGRWMPPQRKDPIADRSIGDKIFFVKKIDLSDPKRKEDRGRQQGENGVRGC